MVHDPNPNAPKPQPYVPVQPFVMPPHVDVPLNSTSVPYIKEEMAENALKQRYYNEARLKRTAAIEEEENESTRLASRSSTPIEHFQKENYDMSPGEQDDEDEDYVPENDLDEHLIKSDSMNGFFDEEQVEF